MDFLGQLRIDPLYGGTERRRKGLQRGIDHFAESVGGGQAVLVGAALDIGDARVQAGFLIIRTNIDGHTLCRIGHGSLVLKSRLTDDTGAELGVERNEVDSRLNVFRDMRDGRKAAPGYDLLDILWLVEDILETRVSAIPIAH